MPDKKHGDLKQLLNRLSKAPSNPGEIHVCPECGGRLHVRIGTYTRQGKSLLGISASCESCGAAMAIDYARWTPEWLKRPTSG
jgi:predicted RNA-binding Zn-ribbon protein involved in translation (DUF1610 family)